MRVGGPKKSGITLIALVVTIVILIILATVSVNLLLNSNIIERAKGAQQLQKIAEEKEQMEFAKVSVAVENKGKIPADAYIESLIQENIITSQNVKYNEDRSIQIMTKMNRTLTMQTDEIGNVIAITEIEQGNKPTVSINKIQLTEKTSDIKVEIEVAKAENATYRYFYKEETGEYKKVYEGKDLYFTIDRLKSGTEYWIKVEATNEYGTVSKELLGKTKEIKKGNESVVDISKISEYDENFRLILLLDVSVGSVGNVTEELFIEAVKRDGSIAEENIMINSNGNYEMITNEGYVFEVVLKSANNIEVNYIGIAQK